MGAGVFAAGSGIDDRDRITGVKVLQQLFTSNAGHFGNVHLEIPLYLPDPNM
jgi:hypothetical protein